MYADVGAQLAQSTVTWNDLGWIREETIFAISPLFLRFICQNFAC
jgi:hypothetical protein